MVAQGVQDVDVRLVKACADDLRTLLDEADFTERKAFLRSFVRRIEGDNRQVTLHYTLPVLPDGKSTEPVGVLPIVPLVGRAGFEPATKGLKVPCSTTELTAHEGDSTIFPPPSCVPTDWKQARSRFAILRKWQGTARGVSGSARRAG